MQEEIVKPTQTPVEIDDSILRPKFKSKLITPNKAKRKTRENIVSLESMTGQPINISL